MKKKLSQMTSQEIKEEMSLAGNPDKIMGIMDETLLLIGKVDNTNSAELLNTHFALQVASAEVRRLHKELGKRTKQQLAPLPTDKYRHFNHHHELTEQHELVNFGTGEFAANKEAIPLLKALNEAGLVTRSHHFGEDGFKWVCIMLDNATVEVRKVDEGSATRTDFNGRHEMLLRWK